MRRPAARLALAAALLALAAPAAKRAAADWLVTRAGTRVETRGAWQVKGKLVVFHTADGTLSSLRLAEVDLDASGRATAQAERARRAAEAAAARAPERKPPVLVLTDDKVRHVEAGAAASSAASPAAPSFSVSSWERSPEADGRGLVITGTLQNTSSVSATEVALSVQLLDADGQVMGTRAGGAHVHRARSRPAERLPGVVPGGPHLLRSDVRTQGARCPREARGRWAAARRYLSEGERNTMKRSALVLLGILAAAGSPAAGDWLVTRAGGRVETKGPWQVKGKLVVFTQTGGSLGSLRLADVDLEASRKATSEALAQVSQKEKPAAPEPPKKKLAVLTDQSFRKPPAVSSVTVAPPEEGAQPVQPRTGGPVTVSAWKRVDSPGSGGVEIQGTLHNTTDYLIVNPSVEVRLYDAAGDSTASAFGVLSAGTIQPKGTIDFRASLPGAFGFAEVRFEPRGLPLDSRPAEPTPESPAPPR